MSESRPRSSQLRYYQFFSLVLVNMLLVGLCDGFFRYPISTPLYSLTGEAIDRDFSQEEIIGDVTVGNIRLFTVQDPSAPARLIAVEQYDILPRCRILQEETLPSLPWACMALGSTDSVIFQVTDSGSIQIESTSGRGRLLLQRYFLIAAILAVAERILWKFIKKHSVSKKVEK